MSQKHKYRHIVFTVVSNRRAHFDMQLCVEVNLSCVCAGDILKANDDLSRVINSYKHIVEGQPADSECEVIRPAVSQGDSLHRLHFIVFVFFPSENKM